MPHNLWQITYPGLTRKGFGGCEIIYEAVVYHIAFPQNETTVCIIDHHYCIQLLWLYLGWRDQQISGEHYF
jgi:hypothetical protein